MNWIENRFVGVPMSRRYGHTTTPIGPHLIVIGGWDGGKPLNDIIVLRDRTVNERGAGQDMIDAFETANQEIEHFVGEDNAPGMGEMDGDADDLEGDDLGEDDEFDLDTGAN
eukprot:2138137-Amphidinium_carterae.1